MIKKRDGLWGVPASQIRRRMRDIVSVFLERRERILAETGEAPSVLVVSAGMYRALCEHPDIRDRVKYTEPPTVTENDALAHLFDVEKVVVLRSNPPAEEGAEFTRPMGRVAWFG